MREREALQMPSLLAKKKNATKGGDIVFSFFETIALDTKTLSIHEDPSQLLNKM